MNLRSEVLDVYVPTEATSVTMGKKVKHHERALYPSYTFIHMIMGPAAHAALLSSEHVINFVGRDRCVSPFSLVTISRKI
jgi:transcription antitermination factor NusG